jgi:hypothetical protein
MEAFSCMSTDEISVSSSLLDIQNLMRRSSLNNNNNTRGFNHRAAFRIKTHRRLSHTSPNVPNIPASPPIVRYYQRRSSITLAHHNLTKYSAPNKKQRYRLNQFNLSITNEL